MTWRQHVVSAAGAVAFVLLAALSWTTLTGRRTDAAVRDGFVVVHRADDSPADDARVVALRGAEVRWWGDTDASGVVPFRRGAGRVEVVIEVGGRWLYRTTLDLDDVFVDVDLPEEPRPRVGTTGVTVAGSWRYDDLSAAVRAALEAPRREAANEAPAAAPSR